MIRVAIIDDHAIVRAGLRQYFSEQVDLTVVAEAANGREALDIVRKGEVDVMVMDLSMPVMGGGEATREVLKVAPEAKVVVLTSFSDRDAVKAALRAGAIGYQLKDAEPTELLAAVRAASQGYAPVDPRVELRRDDHRSSHRRNHQSDRDARFAPRPPGLHDLRRPAVPVHDGN